MMASYHLFSLLGIVLLAYAASLFLVKKNLTSLMKHRRFWNYLLLFSFFLCGLLGLLMALLIDLRYSIAWYREFLWVHVEFGIIMAVVSIIHIIWHWRYFLRVGITK